MSYGFQGPSYHPPRPFIGPSQPPMSQPLVHSNMPYQPPQPQYGPTPPPSAHPAQPHGFPPPPVQSGQPASQPCYNCGATTHWAQYCPEPRRAVPAGSLNQKPDNRPFKRHKPNAPPAIHYPGPASVHPPYPQYSGQYSPPPSSPGYWPPAGYGYGPQPQPYPPYGPQVYPTPVSPYGPQFNSPVYPQTYTPPTNYPAPQAHYPGRSGSQPSGYPYPVQRRPSYQGSPQAWPQQPVFQPIPQTTGPSAQWSPPAQAQGSERSASSSRGAMDVRRKASTDDIDDLGILDFAANEMPMPHAVLVGRPLPANPTADDAFGPLSPPTSDTGRSVSRYFNVDNISQMETSVREMPYWAEIAEDPVFLEFDDSCDMIPLSELRAAHTYHGYSDRANLDECSLVDETRSPPSSEERLNQTEEPPCSANGDGHPGGIDRDKATLNATSQSHTEPGPARDSTEEILARLGVTGVAKPVVKTALVSRPERPKRTRSGSSGHYRRKRSMSPTTTDRYIHDRRSPTGDHQRPSLSSRTTTGSDVDRMDGTEEAEISSNHKDSVRRRGQSLNERQESGERPTVNETFTQSRSAHGGTNGHPDGVVTQQSPQDRDYELREVLHTTAPQGDRTNLKRSASPHDNREEHGRDHNQASSYSRGYRERQDDDRSGQPLRQVDDITPRLKRRQPKVAEAYSRRW